MAISRDYVMSVLQRVADDSMGIDPRRGGMRNPIAAARAAELMGKEIGMFVERSEVRLTDVRSLSADRLLAMLAEIDAGLQLTAGRTLAVGAGDGAVSVAVSGASGGGSTPAGSTPAATLDSSIRS